MSQDKLPVVSRETRCSLIGDFRDNPELLRETYRRLLTEQPELTDQIAFLIEEISNTPEESRCMAEAFILTYKLLESQAEAEGLNKLFGPQLSESLEA